MTNVIRYQMFHSDMPYQSEWVNVKTSSSLDEWVRSWYDTEYYVYDADSCGCDNYEMVIIQVATGEKSMFEIEHSWWITRDPEWDIHNEFRVTKVSYVTFKYPTINRDWMKLK